MRIAKGNTFWVADFRPRMIVRPPKNLRGASMLDNFRRRDVPQSTRLQSPYSRLQEALSAAGDESTGAEAFGIEAPKADRSEEHTSELQSPCNLVCRLLLEKKKKTRSTERPTTPLGFTNFQHSRRHRRRPADGYKSESPRVLEVVSPLVGTQRRYAQPIQYD